MFNNNEENAFRKLKYSYNPQLTSQLSKADGGKVTDGWILSEVSRNESDITEFVKTVSYLLSRLVDLYFVHPRVEHIGRIEAKLMQAKLNCSGMSLSAVHR